MKEQLIQNLSTLINKIETNSLSYSEHLTIMSILSMYNRNFPLDEKNILKYIFTGWYVYECIKDND